ncbi:hypothetical protein [uncultured Alsobacter sp.]|uniref:hypothetical protein n=1 Tax=uncultured Alsobacter sp. TaxID=1748258 RepID=UPI0025D5F0D0|nr:hypothetical protein [uncultured Alsobacter sp.]
MMMNAPPQIPSMTPIRSMHDLLEALPTLGYSKGTANQIRPQIKRCARVYNTDLARIPADPAAFEEKWGRGRVSALSLGFSGEAEFIEWRKRVRAALNRATMPEPAPRRELLPAWVDLLALAKANGGVNRPLPPHLDLSLGLVARLASPAGIAPQGVTDDWAATAIGTLTGKDRRTFRRGLFAIATLLAHHDDVPGLAALLPRHAPALPPAAQVPTSRLRRGAPAAGRLWAEFDAFVAAKRGGQGLQLLRLPDETSFSERTARGYEHTLTAALGLLDRADALPPQAELGLDLFADPTVLETVESVWLARQASGEVGRKTSTLHHMICRLVHVAEWTGVSDATRAALHEIRSRVQEATPSYASMSPSRLEWIKRFAKSPAQQRAVHDLPERLRRDADELAANWPKLAQRERMRALTLGIAALQAGLLFRCVPLRAANLAGLRFRGESPHLDLREGQLRITIPGEEVKNRKSIEAEADSDLCNLLLWYLRVVRTRLIDEHPYRRHLADSDYLFPSESRDAPLEETSFAAHFRAGCRHVGLDMTLHQARHVCAYLILSVDPSAWAEAAAVLGDSIDTVRKYYAWLDQAKIQKQGQDLLAAARRSAKRHQPAKGAALAPAA